MTTDNLPMHYRLDNFCDYDGVHVRLQKWYPISETPKGYWLGNEWYLHAKSWQTLADMKKQKSVRWISKNAARGFCKKGLDEAVKSLLARKKSQIARIELQLQSAQLCIEKESVLNALTEEDFAGRNDVLLGRVDAIDNFTWDY